jgi:neutral ceramidase
MTSTVTEQHGSRFATEQLLRTHVPTESSTMRHDLIAFCLFMASLSVARGEPLSVGVAETDITPPLDYPMSGYYHERLATGTKDPLKAKAIVWKSPETQAAWVICDLTGVGIDLSTAVRERAAKLTGIPADHIIVSATHSHTAPDYYASLYRHLGPPEEIQNDKDRVRAAYAGSLIDHIVATIEQAAKTAVPANLAAGSIDQPTPVSFCRRFVMRDGSVRTWVGLKHPDAVKATASIDPQLAILQVTPVDATQPTGVLSNFALHLDTVGGTEWSGDYPYYIEQSLRGAGHPQVISLFGLGCCGDINHADPLGAPRLKTDSIGTSLGATLLEGLKTLTPVETPKLQARTRIVPLPLEEVSLAEVQQSVQLVRAVNAGEKVEFLDHVRAYKKLMLDTLHHATPLAEAHEQLTWGRTRLWKGIGAELPVPIHVVTFGRDVALVFLPGEVFVELGLAIKQASPFKTTMVIELSQSKETAYVPNRQAYVGGGYEATNTTLQPGGGELLVEAAIELLRESATAAAP